MNHTSPVSQGDVANECVHCGRAVPKAISLFFPFRFEIFYVICINSVYKITTWHLCYALLHRCMHCHAASAHVIRALYSATFDLEAMQTKPITANAVILYLLIIVVALFVVVVVAVTRRQPANANSKHTKSYALHVISVHHCMSSEQWVSVPDASVE